MIFVGLLLVNLAMPIAIVLSGRVFGSVAAMVSTLLDLPSILDRDRAHRKAASDRLATELSSERTKNKAWAEQNRLRENQIASSNQQIKQLKSDNALREAQIKSSNLALKAKDLEMRRLASDLAFADGKTVSLRQEVAETTKRLHLRARGMSQRNLLSMGGESVPFWGMAVVVAATTLELNDTCEMMKDMYRLNSSLNGQAAEEADEVCKQIFELPTREQLRDRIAQSPAAVVAGARVIYGGLPDFQWKAGWDILVRDIWSLFEASPN